MRRDEATLIDIQNAAQSALSFIEGMDKQAFLADLRTQKAVIYDIQTVGEAVKRLSKPFCIAHPEIPWSQMAGMRDKLAHDYDHVNVDRVWLVVSEDLPELLKLLKPLIQGGNP